MNELAAGYHLGTPGVIIAVAVILIGIAIAFLVNRNR